MCARERKYVINIRNFTRNIFQYNKYWTKYKEKYF